MVFEGDVLYTIQEQNLFLHTPLFFEQQMVKAGGLLTWAGSYLTQFFYYPALGAGLLCLLWALLVFLLGKAFAIPSSWMMLTVVPVASLLLTITGLGYWTFFLKLPGHAFCSTVGSIVAVGLAWLYRELPQRFCLPTLFILLATAVGYPLFGFYGLWASVLMALIAWRHSRRRIADVLVSLLSVVFVPLLCYHLLYHETNIVNIYWAALPVYAMRQEVYPAFYLPYAVLVASTFVMALFPFPRLSLRYRTVRFSVLACTVVCVALFWYKDDNFHRELSMSRSIDRHDWQQVLRLGKGCKGEPTRAVCMMQNLALFRLGRPAEETLLYPNGAKHPQAPFPVRMVHTYGKQLYLQYGVPNYCYRWCMEDGVERGWTVAGLKLMAQCSLLNGETVAAQRMLNLLKKTDFHRTWALDYEQFLRKPRLMSQDAGLRPILPLLRADNFLTADQSQFELFLIEQILSTPGTTREQQELARRTAYYYQHNRSKLAEQ